jgi:hypothetical protein
VLLLLEFVEDEVLEGFRERRGSELAVADFLGSVSTSIYQNTVLDKMPAVLTNLDVAVHVILDRLESC